MEGIQLSGLASGFDWQSLVERLIEVERAPQTRLRTEQTFGTQRSTALGTLNTRLTALKDSLASLSGGTSDIFAARSAQFSSTTTTWTASAATGTNAGTYAFNVTRLATASVRTGATDAGRALSTTTDVSGLTIGTLPIGTPITAGEFTVNGARITVETTDSLQAVLARVSTATGGAVTASYVPATDRIRLNSSATITVGSANDTSNFLSAFQLFNNGTTQINSAAAVGVVNTGATIANANLRTAVTGVDGAGEGTFAVNGVNFTYNVNTDTVRSVMDRINASTAGVTATYDRLTDRFALRNNSTGDLGVTVTEGANGLMAGLRLTTTSTLTRGVNALFTLNGGSSITSTSNTLDATTHGIAGLSVKADTTGTQTVTVAGDNTSARAKIEDFIAKYNAVQSYIDEQTRSSTSTEGRVTTAPLTGNQEVTGIGSALRARVFDSVPGLTGAIQRLESIGIDFKTSSSELEIKDGTKLDAALRDNASAVRTLFSSSATGLGARLTTYLTQVTGTTGTIATQTATISKNSKSIDDQIAAIERRIVQQREILTQNFIKMEEAQSRIQSQLAALTNAFGGSSS
jgi:flagellar hook-associated protein 2